MDADDLVTVERDFDGVPDPSFPPKGIVKEIERRYGLRIDRVEFPAEGRIRVVGHASPGAEESLHSDLGGV
jgi:hypothetical protein